MPRFKFEAMDATGMEIRDVIEAPTEEEAQSVIRQMGYFVTMIRPENQEYKPRPYNRSISRISVTKTDLLCITVIIMIGIDLLVRLLSSIIR